MKYANEYGYSDVYPYEVVRIVSDKTIEVRRMRTEVDPAWPAKMQYSVGGFAGHMHNQREQTWFYHSDPDAPVIRIRLTKRGWAHKGCRFKLADEPHYFYDYNF